jgi:hypothetical protein
MAVVFGARELAGGLGAGSCAGKQAGKLTTEGSGRAETSVAAGARVDKAAAGLELGATRGPLVNDNYSSYAQLRIRRIMLRCQLCGGASAGSLCTEGSGGPTPHNTPRAKRRNPADSCQQRDLRHDSLACVWLHRCRGERAFRALGVLIGEGSIDGFC